jgi:polyphosphate glucokinase
MLRPSLASHGAGVFAPDLVVPRRWPEARKHTVLMIDVGGTNVKLACRTTGGELVKFRSGSKLSADAMVTQALRITRKWGVTAVTLGFPGLVRDNAPAREPLNLGGGWLGYDYEAALACPVRIINDAAMQALAAYSGKGRMLFVGFGTSVGCALIADGVLTNIETGLIPLTRRECFKDRLSKEARRINGHARWQQDVDKAVALLQDMFWPDETVIGGGTAKHLNPLPSRCRRISNREALKGAERMWPGSDLYAESVGTTWRIAN